MKIIKQEVLRHALPYRIEVLGNLGDIIKEETVEIHFRQYFGMFIKITLKDDGTQGVIQCPKTSIGGHDRKHYTFDEGEVYKSNSLLLILFTDLETSTKILYIVKDTFEPTRIKVNIR